MFNRGVAGAAWSTTWPRTGRWARCCTYIHDQMTGVLFSCISPTHRSSHDRGLHPSALPVYGRLERYLCWPPMAAAAISVCGGGDLSPNQRTVRGTVGWPAAGGSATCASPSVLALVRPRFPPVGGSPPGPPPATATHGDYVGAGPSLPWPLSPPQAQHLRGRRFPPHTAACLTLPAGSSGAAAKQPLPPRRGHRLRSGAPWGGAPMRAPQPPVVRIVVGPPRPLPLWPPTPCVAWAARLVPQPPKSPRTRCSWGVGGAQHPPSRLSTTRWRTREKPNDDGWRSLAAKGGGSAGRAIHFHCGGGLSPSSRSS